MVDEVRYGMRPARPDPLHVLTHSVRLMSVAQIARRWFMHAVSPQHAAFCWLHRKAVLGLFECRTMTLYPQLVFKRPLFEWHPGMEEPNFGAIAWRAAARWREAPVATVVVQATYKAKVLTGGFIGGRPIRQTEANHDHQLAALFLALEKAAEGNFLWKSEDELKARGLGFAGGLLPDAFIANTGPVIDFIGSYSPRKLSRMHHAFKDERYLWF